jgi:hypothetical protein
MGQTRVPSWRVNFEETVENLTRSTRALISGPGAVVDFRMISAHVSMMHERPSLGAIRRWGLVSRPVRVYPVDFQSLSVFILGVSLGPVDGGVFRVRGSDGRARGGDGRSGDARRFLAGRAARRGEVLSWYGAAADAAAARTRLPHGVLTRPPGHLLLSLNKFITRKQ